MQQNSYNISNKNRNVKILHINSKSEILSRRPSQCRVSKRGGVSRRDGNTKQIIMTKMQMFQRKILNLNIGIWCLEIRVCQTK
jgi:hypothetical protein